MGLIIKAMIEDMEFNLAPSADVYKRNNPDEEEAIKCIEALARVPQQVMKWGYLTTMATMQDLYKIYYHEVIPSLIQTYNSVTGNNYQRDYHHHKKTFFRLVSKLFSRKEEDNLLPVRDL